MAKVIPFTEARSELTNILDEVGTRHEHVVITRKGLPAAVVLSPNEYESLQETLEILQDSATISALERSERDVGKGDLMDWGKVKRELGLAQDNPDS